MQRPKKNSEVNWMAAGLCLGMALGMIVGHYAAPGDNNTMLLCGGIGLAVGAVLGSVLTAWRRKK